MKKELKVIIGTALLFTIITCIPSLINRLGQSIALKSFVGYFLVRSLPWVLAVAAIIASLIIIGNKLSEDFLSEIKENQLIHFSAGILSAIEGIIAFSSMLPVIILSIQSSVQMYNQFSKQLNLKVSIIVNIISILVYLCQVLFSIYLICHSRKSIDIKEY